MGRHGAPYRWPAVTAAGDTHPRRSPGVPHGGDSPHSPSSRRAGCPVLIRTADEAWKAETPTEPNRTPMHPSTTALATASDTRRVSGIQLFFTTLGIFVLDAVSRRAGRGGCVTGSLDGFLLHHSERTFATKGEVV